MGQLRRIFLQLTLITVFGLALSTNSVWADGNHAHPEEKEEMHHHSSPSKKGPDLPPGTKEAKIMLTGPFCSKHPEEITAGLMKHQGVIHVEAFSSRDYILVHYDGDQANPMALTKTVDAMQGSGWRCDAKLAKKMEHGTIK